MGKKRSFLIIFIILFMISIGFAVLSTNLRISGLFGYKKNKWDVHFDNMNVSYGSVEATELSIEENTTSIYFNVNFSSPGEYYDFYVDVVNAGTIDAMINNISISDKSLEYEDYLTYTLEYFDGSEVSLKDLLRKDSKTRLHVRLDYNYDVDEVANVGEQDFSLELEYLKSDETAVDRVSELVTSNNITSLSINDAKENSLTDLRIYGSNEQKTYQGYQLIQKDGLSTPNSDKDFWNNTANTQPLSDGWRRVSYDNTSGTGTKFANFFINKEYLQLEPDTQYTAFVEYKNLSGTGGYIVLTQLTMWPEEPFSSSSGTVALNSTSGKSTILLTTKSDLSSTLGIRGWVSIPAGDSITVDIRLMIVKGDRRNEDLEYEPYVGEKISPNPEYPQEVNSVNGDISLEIKGKNLLNYLEVGEVAKAYGSAVNSDGYVYDSTPTGDGRNWKYKNSNFFSSLGPGTYTLSLIFDELTKAGSNANGSYDTTIAVFNDNDEEVFKLSLRNEQKIEYTFTLNESTNIGILAKSYEGTYRIQLEEGSQSTEWEPYIGKNYLINLGGIELNGIGNYRDYIHYMNSKWYIHRGLSRKVLTSNDTWHLNNGNELYQRVSGAPSYLNSEVADVLSNRYIKSSRNNLTNGHICISKYNNLVISETPEKRDVDIYKEFLQNNNTYVIYPLQEGKEEEIKDDNLINQLNAILEDNLYEGYNYVTLTSNIKTDIEFNYIRK